MLAIVDDVNTQLRLALHNVRDSLADAGLKGSRVVRLAAGARRKHVEKVRWTRQAANVGGEDPLRTQLHAVTSYEVPSAQPLF